MTTLVLAGSKILATCDTATEDGAGNWTAMTGDVAIAIYQPATGVTGSVSDVTLPADYAPGMYSFANGIFSRLPDTQEQIQEAISQKLDALSLFAETYEWSGTTVAGTYWDTDDATQAKLDAANNLVGKPNAPTQFVWKFSTGFSVFTPDEVQAAALQIGIWVEGVIATSHSHASNILALTSVAAVEAYDFTTGWPQGT